MSSPRQLRRIAESVGLSPSEAISRLQAAGLPYESERQLVASNSVAEVLRILVRPRSDTTDASDPRADEPAWRRGVPADTSSGLAHEVTAPRRRTTGFSTPRKPPKTSPAQRPIPASHVQGPILGNPSNGPLQYLSRDGVIRIHETLVRDFANSPDPVDPPGVRENGVLLESALGRQSTSLGATLKYPTVHMTAAALFHALIHDHPFHNGNKRTAIVSLLVFLDAHGYMLTSSEDALFAYTLALAAHETPTIKKASGIHADDETYAAAQWIVENSRKIDKRHRVVTWRDLQKILDRYGCTLEKRTGNSWAIRRGEFITHAGARNDGDEIDVSALQHVRSQLKLDEPSGIDSMAFFYGAEEISGFINKYRQILTKLAAY